MFPPQKNDDSAKPKPKAKPQGPGGPPQPGQQQAGPPDPFAGGGQPPMGPPGMDPFGSGGGVMPPGGGPPPGLQEGMPKPGQGMDPMKAMMNGLGPDPMQAMTPQAQGPPLGPGGMPVGGALPEDPTEGTSDSPLLQALMGGLAGGGDPYAVAPGQPDQGFQGMGPQDPNMGIEQLLQMLALGQMGVGGGPQPGSSGAMDLGPFPGAGVGGMVGF